MTRRQQRKLAGSILLALSITTAAGLLALWHYDDTVPVSARVDYRDGDSIAMKAEDFDNE